MVIDDDLLAVAKNLAQERSQSIGEVISELARQGLESALRIDRRASGFPVFAVPKNAKPITSEDVKRIEDEI